MTSLSAFPYSVECHQGFCIYNSYPQHANIQSAFQSNLTMHTRNICLYIDKHLHTLQQLFNTETNKANKYKIKYRVPTKEMNGFKNLNNTM